MPTLSGTSRPIEDENEVLKSVVTEVLGPTQNQNKLRAESLSRSSPDEAARQYRLSRDTGTPIPLVRSREQEIRAQSIANQIDWSALQNEAPRLLSRVRDPELGPAIFDDIPILSLLETSARARLIDNTFVRPFRRSGFNLIIGEGGIKLFKGEFDQFAGGELQKREIKGPLTLSQQVAAFGGKPPPALGRAKTQEQLEQALPPNFRDSYAQRMRELGRELEAKGIETAEAGALQHKLASELRDEFLPNQFAGPLDTFLGEATEAVFTSVIPLMGVSLVPFLGPAAGLGLMQRHTFGTKYAEARTDRENPRSPQEAAVDATIYSLAEVIPETIPLGIALKTGKAGIRALLKKSLHTAVAESAQEALTEIIQTAYDAGVVGVDMTLKQALLRIAKAGALGFLIGAPMGGLGGIARDNAGKHEDYKKGQSWIDTAVANTKISKTFKRDPKLFEEVTDDTLGEIALYADAKSTKILFQDKEELFEEFAKTVPEIKEQIEEAVDYGGDLILPANKVISALAQNPEFAEFQKLFRPTPEAITEQEHADAVLDVLDFYKNERVDIDKMIKDPRIENVSVSVRREVAEDGKLVTEKLKAKDALQEVKDRLLFAEDLIKCLNA